MSHLSPALCEERVLFHFSDTDEKCTVLGNRYKSRGVRAVGTAEFLSSWATISDRRCLSNSFDFLQSAFWVTGTINYCTCGSFGTFIWGELQSERKKSFIGSWRRCEAQKFVKERERALRFGYQTVRVHFCPEKECSSFIRTCVNLPCFYGQYTQRKGKHFEDK